MKTEYVLVEIFVVILINDRKVHSFSYLNLIDPKVLNFLIRKLNLFSETQTKCSQAAMLGIEYLLTMYNDILLHFGMTTP